MEYGNIPRYRRKEHTPEKDHNVVNFKASGAKTLTVVELYRRDTHA